MTWFRILVAVISVQAAFSQQPGARASIAGIVVSAGSGTPIGKATVELIHIENGKVSSRTETSNAAGEFLFRDLPAGTGYQLVATGTGLQPTAHGQRSSRDPWIALTLGPGERLEGVKITARMFTSMQGRVEDQGGQGLVGASVSLMKPEWLNGRRILQQWSSTVTDTRGGYRFLSIPTGPYYLRVMPLNSESAYALMLNPGLVDLSESRPRNEPEGYPLVYFPGTDITAAEVIQVGEASTITNPPVRVAKVRTSRIRGAVVDQATGANASSVQVIMTPEGRSEDSSLTRVFVSDNGQFDIRGVLPGLYRLTASALRGTEPLYGRIPVDVREGQPQMLTVPVSPAPRITGRLTVADWVAASAPDFSQLTLRLEPDLTDPLDGGLPGIPREQRPVLAVVSAEGLFTLNRVPPGDYRVELTEAGTVRGAYVKSILLGSHDVLREGLHVEPATTGSMEIVLATNSGGLDGRILNERGESPPVSRAVLVPDDRRRRDLYALAIATNTGRFQFRDIAPGSYKVFAWPYVSNGAWMDPHFMSAFENEGTPVRIDEGSAEYVEIPLITR